MLIPALKYVWRHFGLRTAYLDMQYRALLREWRNDPGDPDWAPPAVRPVVLLIPPDPALLIASKGDEAMLSVITRHFRDKWPDVRFIVATAGDEADRCAESLGAEPLRLLDESLGLRESLALLAQRGVGVCVTVGADVLDGSYSQAFSGKLLMLTGMLARRGVECVVTGFSVSERPYPRLGPLLDEFGDKVVFNLRDPKSYARFKALTRARANLVADVAFLLEPRLDTAAVEATGDWCRAQRAAGRKVIGLNLHPLLLDLNERQHIQRVIDNVTDAARSMIDQQRISLVLLDHDFRGDSADHHCLDQIERALQGGASGAHLFRPRGRLSAAELKGVAGCLDGIVSGRMHLMIASCGAGTPVFGIEYKGKMGGLMEHFQLDTANLSSASEIMRAPETFHAKLSRFIDNLAACRQQLLDNKTEIKRLSSLNFAQFR